MLTDQPDEATLFSEFDSLAPHQAAALRAIEKTRQMLVTGIQEEEMSGRTPAVSESFVGVVKGERPSRTRTLALYGLAAAALLVVVFGVHFVVTWSQGERVVSTNTPSPPRGSPDPMAEQRPGSFVAKHGSPRPSKISADKPPDSSLRLKPDEGDAVLLTLIDRHPNFARVDVGGSQVTGAGLAHLRRLKNLTHVGLDGAQVTAEGIRHLQELSRLEGVEAVRATDDSVAHLKELKNLTELGLSNSGELTNAGLAHLAGLDRLQRLSLTNNDQIDDAGMAHLKGLEAIRELKLNGTGITDRGLEHLSGLRHLKHLDVSRTTVGDAGLRQLESLTGLQELQLGDTQVTDAGLPHLSSLTDLTSLGLYRLKVTDAGMQHLKPLKKLKVLGLYGTKVSDAAVEELRKGLPQSPPSTFGER